MEKYYMTKMDELEPGTSATTTRLLEVQFLRRPPTIGILFAGRATNRENKSQSIKLATLSLNNENKAKFAINREVSLTGADGGISPLPVVSLDTYNRGQLLIEGSHNPTSSGNSKSFEHMMSSSVFALTENGHIWAVSMLRRDIDGGDGFATSELLKECKPSRNVSVAGPNKYLQLQIQQAGSSQDEIPDTGRIFHVLSRQCYSAYKMRPLEFGSPTPPPGGATAPHKTTRPRYLGQCELVLEHEFSLGVASAAPPGDLLQPVELARMLPLDSRDASVLLESSDGSLRVIRQGRCIWTIEAPTSATSWPPLRRRTTTRQLPRQSLMLLQSREAASGACDNILLSLTCKNQLVAHSLSINTRANDQVIETPSDHLGRRESEDLKTAIIGGGDDDDDDLGNADDSRDPDRLLPREPSFELEECWSIELDELLNSISGLLSHSALESSDDDDDDDAGGGYLCVPVWLPQSSVVAAASAEDESTRRWPEFLLLFHKVHVLVFSFGQEDDTLPFSVVYDRAFLNLTGGFGGGESNDQKLKAPPQRRVEKRVDLHVRPRLLHNIKLVGTQPSDCLFNLIFLSSHGASGRGSSTCISQARHFNQLGLMAAITSEGHVLAFKLTSPKVVDPNRKDNLYQQQLLESLRDESLLRDELARLQEISSQLQEDTAKLEGMLETVGRGDTADAAESEQSTTCPLSSVGMLRGGGGEGHLLAESPNPSREIQVRLEHHALVGGLYELSVECSSSLIRVLKVIVCSTVDGSEIFPPSPGGGSSLIDNVQFSGNRGRNAEELFSSNDNDKKPEAAMAVLELKRRSDDSPAAAAAAGESMPRVQVTLFLQDTGQTATGHVKVYVIFAEKTHALQGKGGMDAYSRQLSSRKSSEFDYLQHELEVSSADSHQPGNDHANFILHELPVKPLMSYRLLAHHEQDDADTNISQMNTLEASGLFGGDQLFAWLDELLNMTSSGDSTSLFKFKSNLTGCSLDIKIERALIASSHADQSATLRMLVTSRDLDALDLIKKHTLKRATDNSIQLNIQQSGDDKRSSQLTIDEHRRKNSQLVESVKRAAAEWNVCPPSSAKAEESQTQKDMLLDNLFGEMDQMLEVNGGVDHFLFGQAAGEPTKFANFLKRSLCQDVEQLFGQ